MVITVEKSKSFNRMIQTLRKKRKASNLIQVHYADRSVSMCVSRPSVDA